MADRTPTQALVLDLLTARHRLGEQIWTLAANGSVKRALVALEADGLVGWKSGIVSDTYLAWLTDEGKAEQMSPTYTPPIEAEAGARALIDFADSTRFPSHWILFRRADGSGVTVSDLLRETAARVAGGEV